MGSQEETDDGDCCGKHKDTDPDPKKCLTLIAKFGAGRTQINRYDLVAFAAVRRPSRWKKPAKIHGNSLGFRVLPRLALWNSFAADIANMELHVPPVRDPLLGF